MSAASLEQHRIEDSLQTRLDVGGIAVAVLCAIHCVGPAVLVVLLPALALPWLESPWIEWGLLAISAALGGIAIVGSGWRQHRRVLPLVLFALGLATLVMSRLEWAVGERGELPFVVVGAVLIVAAHLRNLRCRASSGSTAHGSQVATRGPLLLLAVGLSIAPVSVSAQASAPTPARATTPSTACFDLSSLAPRERGIAERLLRDAGDGEALYTLGGGLKPVSTDFLSITLTVAPDTNRVVLDSIARVRAATEALRCGPISFHMAEFAATYTRTDSSRYRVIAVYAVHREALARAIAKRSAFWSTIGVRADAPVDSVLDAVERAPRSPRWRGYGYLFGYPDEAVDFFVRAGESQDSTGVFVARDFRRVETYRKFPAREGEAPSLSSFVYAVPKGAPESAADRALIDAAAPIYARYVAERDAAFAAPDGAVTLWRRWIGAASSTPPSTRSDTSVDPFTAPRPRLRAARAAAPIRIDGRLDEAAWATASVADMFQQVRPDFVPDVRFPTEVRVLFDDRNLYVAAFMRDAEARTGLRVRDLRREFDFSENENFSVTLGPLGDKRTAYQFSVTPYGSQRDVQAFDGGDTQNENWDGQWTVRTQVTDSGWVAEIAIPWATVRYAPGAGEWAVNFVRNARRALETSAWAPFPRQFSSYRLTFAGTVDGLEPPPSRAAVRYRPFVLSESRRQPDAAGGFTTSGAAGGEILWAPTANSTMDLTVRTDFAQADVDRQVVNLQRFSVFFPERRQFFLENADVLSVTGLDGRYALQPFFTRRIGLADDGTPIPIDAGARYALRSSRLSLGALATRQRAQGDNGASTFGVLRGSRFIGASTRVGALTAIRHDDPGRVTPGSTNVVTAFDALGRIGEQIQINGMVSTSTLDGKTGVAASYFAGRDTPGLYTGFLGALVSKDYAPRTGFVSRNDVLVSSPAIVGTWQPAWRPKDVVLFKPAVVTYFYNTPSTLRLQEGFIDMYIDVLHRSGAIWYPYVQRHLQRPTQAFDILPGVGIAAGTQDYWRYGWYGTTDQSASWVLSTNVSTGGFFDGRMEEIVGTARWAPSPRIAMNVDYTINRLRAVGVNDTTLTTQLIAPELRLAWSPRLQLAAFYQYNTVAGRGALNARAQWEFAPLSFVYLVVNDRQRLWNGPSVPREGDVILKVVWMTGR